MGSVMQAVTVDSQLSVTQRKAQLQPRSESDDEKVKRRHGFMKCRCTQSCNKNDCKCFKAKVLCNSRCHNRRVNTACLNPPRSQTNINSTPYVISNETHLQIE